MGLIKIFITLVLIGILLWFLALNVGEVIGSLHIFGITFHDIPLVHVLLAAFTIGVLVGFFIPVFHVLGARAEARRFERENRKLRRELNDLRNVSIDEAIEPAPEATEPEEEEQGEIEEKTDLA